ncbi:hypothetical protein [Microtetraspora sp. NBRC 13810]|nr:hypothetical protein [Microtetraspora sp. NBRC 13810]
MSARAFYKGLAAACRWWVAGVLASCRRRAAGQVAERAGGVR